MQKKPRPSWTVVCSTEEEWRQLAESFKKSKHKDEKMLYETLSVDFVPEIGKMIEAKVLMYTVCGHLRELPVLLGFGILCNEQTPHRFDDVLLDTKCIPWPVCVFEFSQHNYSQ